MPLLAGYMVPHPPIAVKEIGRGEELKIADTLASFDEVAADIAVIKPDTIILTSPHSILYRDYFHISPGKTAIRKLSDISKSPRHSNTAPINTVDPIH